MFGSFKSLGHFYCFWLFNVKKKKKRKTKKKKRPTSCDVCHY